MFTNGRRIAVQMMYYDNQDVDVTIELNSKQDGFFVIPRKFDTLIGVGEDSSLWVSSSELCKLSKDHCPLIHTFLSLQDVFIKS